MKLLISEILPLIEKAETKQEKVKLLLQYETPCLRGLMKINFNPDVDMGLPLGTPPYKKIDDKPIGTDHSSLEYEYKKFYFWLVPGNLTKTKKEHLFVLMLEALHYTEAEILILVKDKSIQYRFPSITKELIQEVWPFLIPPESDEGKPETKKRGRPRKNED